MAHLTEEMKTFIARNLAYIATVNDKGVLNVGPKMSIRVLDDSHLMYYERTAGQTYRNLKTNGKAVIAVARLDDTHSVCEGGYRFRGPMTLHNDDAIFEEAVEIAREKGLKLPVTVPVMEITEIEDLTVGNAGQILDGE